MDEFDPDEAIEEIFDLCGIATTDVIPTRAEGIAKLDHLAAQSRALSSWLKAGGALPDGWLE